MKKMTKKEEKEFYESFKDVTPRKVLKVGDTVELSGDHSFAGHKGEVTGFSNIMGQSRPKVRLFDMCDHEVFAMKPSHIKVLS